MNISDKVNYILFITVKTITDVNTVWTISHLAVKTSLTIFKFMKAVELKYWRFANSNDAIFNTDLASLRFFPSIALRIPTAHNFTRD